MVIKQSSIEKVYQSIVETISLVLGMPSAIWLFNDKGEMTIRASVGLPEKYKKIAKLGFYEDAIAMKVFRSGEPIFVADIEKEPSWKYKEQAKNIGIKSAWVFPLYVRKKVTGVLDVYNLKSGDFNTKEKQIIASFAEQTALAVSYFEGFELLNNVSVLINSSLYQKELFDEIMKAAENVLDCEHVSLFLATQDDKLVLKSSSSPKIVRTEFAFGSGLAGWVANEHIPVLVDNAFNDERFVPGLSDSTTERSMLVVPILQDKGTDEEKQLVGIISADKHGKAQFNEQDVALMEAFARQAAVALENADLLRQLENRATAFKSLHDVTAELVSITEAPKSLDKILYQIAEKAKDVLGADLIDIYQYIKNEDRFILPPVQIGERKNPEVIKDKIYKDDVLYAIIGGGATLYTKDAQSESNLTRDFSVERANIPRERFVIREGIQSSASIPMVVDNEVVGVLFVNFRSQQTFSAQQQELIELFASQAAIAIRNNRLYIQLQRSNQELENLQSLGRKLTVETDLDKLLHEFLKSIYEVLGFEYATVSLVDRTQNFIETRHGIWQGEVDTFPKWIEMSKYHLEHEDIQADIVRKGKAEVISGWDERFNKEIWEKFHHDRLIRIYMPIKIQDEVIGTVEAGYDKSQQDQISLEQQQTLRAFVDQAALAIQNARQFREIERNLGDRLSDFQAIQEITEQMHQGDLEEVLNLIAERAVELTRAKHGGVWLVNKTRTSLIFGGLADKENYDQLPPDIPLGKDSENSISRWVVENKQSYLSGDIRKDENYKFYYGDTISELTVPIIYQDRIIGTINVESEQVDRFTQEHLRLLEAMAGQAAIVVQNSKLLENLEHRVKALATLSDVGKTLTADIHLPENEILKLIFEQTQKLTGTQDIYIALYNKDTGELSFPLATQRGEEVKYPSRKADMDKRGKTEDIIFTGTPLLHQTKKEAENWYSQPGHQEFVGVVQPSWLGVPMMVGERVLGVIAVYDMEKEFAYDELDRDVLITMASQAAIALDNANLFYDVNLELAESNKQLAESNKQLAESNKQLEYQVDALDTLERIGRELTSGIRLQKDEIITLIFDQTQKLTGTQDIYVALYNEDTNEISFPLATQRGQRVEYPPRKANMEKRGKTEDIIFTKHPVLHRTKKEAEEWYSQPGHNEFVGLINPSWLGVPMMVGERVLGVIAIYDMERENVFDDFDHDILVSMASQAAIALDNATLYYDVNQKLEQANQQLEETNQQLEKANIELRQAHEREIFTALGEVAAGLIHKMSNTIGHVPALVNRIIKSIDPKDEDAIRKLNQIKEGVSDALEYIGSMGKVLELQEIMKAEADLELLIGDAIRQTIETVDRRDIEIEKNCVGLPTVYVNSPLIIEVFRNILQNATEAMPDGGLIKINGTTNNIKVSIQIIDTGYGILEEDKHRLFRLGFSTKKEGKGIGLWFSRTVIEQHQGTIEVESEKDKGTIFLISLPVGTPINSIASFE